MTKYVSSIFIEYKDMLEGVGPMMKEIILARAAHDKRVPLKELRELVSVAYPDDTP